MAEQMLIKDPYLASQRKETVMRATGQIPMPAHNTSTQSQPIYNDFARNRAYSGGVQANQLRGRVQVYQKELRNMQEAYKRQEDATKKFINYNEVNRQYHEAMKNRNFELNTKLQQASSEIQLIQHRTSEEQNRYTHDKDVLFKKYEEQSAQYLRLRANYNALLQQKTRLEEQLNHVSFLLEKEAHQHELQIKQQILRMDSMDRTYKALVSAKEQQIGQLTHRLRIYQDENRKLNDINKTFQLQKQRSEKIDNLSQINHLQSNIKSRTYQKDNKQNQDGGNVGRSNIKEYQQLKQQRNINEQLRRQLQNIKKQMQQIKKINSYLQNEVKKSQIPEKRKQNGEINLLETSKWQGLMTSVGTIRQGINKQIFQIFFKSIKDGQKKKQNSLLIFIQNWRAIDMERLQPYIKSYFQARNNLKQIAQTKKAKQSVHYPKIEETVPLHVGSKPGRSNINQWILSTIQFTKNQKQNSKKTLNNFILFLFRLLTIEYRIRYPMQGKSYQVDEDVTNQLFHQIIKGVQLIFKYN